ncbi:MAG: hypothetical protein ACTS4V_01755 [Candidatus Hodgkinia cicadicola]
MICCDRSNKPYWVIKSGLFLVYSIKKSTVRMISSNNLIVSKVLQSNEENYGFDILTGYYGSMFAMGITDSF